MIFSLQTSTPTEIKNIHARWFHQREREPPESTAGYTTSRGPPYTRVEAYLPGDYTVGKFSPAGNHRGSLSLSRF
ncbi:hypothetical protein F2Q70_00044675 [Brassica cretica]|uniref:Uncharacterized protein n=2 Tax=Brassica cretica TaxID=69181 RepID=A0A8S9LMR5_BRACR|nr:hypothetical protein F2Q70_00044675 [Brassica cretica]KAF2609320.1 hypothetical protein F2Q68_00045625 [Brassica cretica]KAF3516267.1 hypothetical protein DY000_02062619 [Brassica cretica]